MLAPLSASNEASVLRHVINRCEELLDEFPTSQADDERLMRELQASGRRDDRLELALTYRMEVCLPPLPDGLFVTRSSKPCADQTTGRVGGAAQADAARGGDAPSQGTEGAGSGGKIEQ